MKASSLTMIVAPRSSSAMLAFSAAGFMATRTFGASPGVRMSREAKWIWNADTPASVPAGARISAGKFGSVARSLPTTAVASVKRLPVSCMPSPESPAKRMITRSRSSTVLAHLKLSFVRAYHRHRTCLLGPILATGEVGLAVTAQMGVRDAGSPGPTGLSRPVRGETGS